MLPEGTGKLFSFELLGVEAAAAGEGDVLSDQGTGTVEWVVVEAPSLATD